MRAYREAFSQPGKRRGLSQDELLERMAEVDASYGRRFSHATVTRWETGATRPNAERLRVFGKALDLSETEVEGLITLAGLALPSESTGTQVSGAGRNGAVVEREDSSRDASAVSATTSKARDGTRSAGLLSAGRRFLVFRVLLPALYVVAGGYVLNAMGWNDDWMPLAYLMITSLLVMTQAFVWPDRRRGLLDFYWVSMFILLAFPALRFAPLGLDHYGFYRVGDLAGTHVPHMLMLLVAVALAGLSTLAFQLLWAWQISGPRAERTALTRATWAVVPATLLSYGPVIVFSGTTVWVQSTVSMPILVGAVITMLVIRDPGTKPDPVQCRFLLHAAFSIVIVAATLGAITIVMVYWLPDLRMVLPDHNLLGSWRIDFGLLGYTPEQVMQRLDTGYMWHSMCLFAYMVAVVSGSMLIAVYRLGGRAGNGPHAVRAKESEDSLPLGEDVSSRMLGLILQRPALTAISRR